MARKLSITLSLLALALALTTASFANGIPTDVIFGTSTGGSVTVSSNSVTFSGNVHGTAYQGQSVGTYTISNSSNLMPDISVWIGSDQLVGNFSITAITIINSNLADLSGTFTVDAGTTQGFIDSGFPVGAMVDADLTIYKGKISAGEVVADPVPEPGTIAMMGSGLLLAAGALRRKLL